MEDRNTLQINERPLEALTVQRFLDRVEEPLGLGLVAGERGLGRVIEEPVLYRPGLALTGFLTHFANHRPQLLGRAEMAYLLTLPPEERRERWEGLLKQGVPCVLLCHPEGVSLGGDLLKVADTLGVPVLATFQESLDVFRIGALLLHELTAKEVSLHGTLMEVGGVGVLLRGPPGIGKSETALGLLRRGHALIADDQPYLSLDAHGRLHGRAAGEQEGYFDIRGLGLLSAPHLFGALSVKHEGPLDIIVNLCRANDELANVQGELKMRQYTILGTNVPGYDIPVAAGRDFVNVVELAAALFRLRGAGIDFAALLDQRMIARTKTLGRHESL